MSAYYMHIEEAFTKARESRGVLHIAHRSFTHREFVWYDTGHRCFRFEDNVKTTVGQLLKRSANLYENGWFIKPLNKCSKRTMLEHIRSVDLGIKSNVVINTLAAQEVTNELGNQIH